MSSYQTVFLPANDIELMGVYLWNAHVTGALYPLMGAVEISLRNAIDRAITAFLGSFWWSGHILHYRTFTRGGRVPDVVQRLRDNFASATRKFVSDQRARHGVQGRVTPHHHGVVAKTEFSTWQFLLDPEFMGRGLIWPRCLGVAFAGTWPSTGATAVLSHAHDLVQTLREFRNRMFHHEPAWKRYGVLTEVDAIKHLREKLAKIEELLALIHPESLNLLQKNGLLQTAYRACTSEEIRRFQHLAQVHPISTLADLSTLVGRCATENSTLHAKLEGCVQPRFMVFSY
jgi:hypothetical protein